MTAGDTFSELASGSLPILGGGDASLQPWNRSLRELKAASEALVGGPGGGQQRGQATTTTTTSAVHELLGNRDDFMRLTGSLKSSKPVKAESFVSVEETLQQYRDGVMERILSLERDQTRQKSQEQVEKQLKEDWSKERDWWLKEFVGTRTLGGSAKVSYPSRSGSEWGGHSNSSTTAATAAATSASSSSPLDTTMWQTHFQIVQDIETNSSLANVLSKFKSLPPSATAASPGYTTSWNLLYSMLPNMSSPIDCALGALIHFCTQFQKVIAHRVRSSSLAGQDVSPLLVQGPGMVSIVASYVKIEFGIDATIWHVLYFCLQCGDATAARNALEASTMQKGAVEAPIRTALATMSQRQATSSCLWERGPPILEPKDRQAIADLYERENSRDTVNLYKVGTLALISGTKPIPSAGYRGFNMIEDFLVGGLWQALQHTNPLQELSNLGGRIQEFGPSYFNDEESGGWSYALPLLALQQFRAALKYLAEVGGPTGLLQATHLALAISLAGVPVEDLGKEKSSDCLVTALLVAYGWKLHQQPLAGTKVSLEYFLRIPNKARGRKEIASLVVRSYGTDTLGGVLSPDGVRQKATLDERLPREAVSSILADAAEIFRKEAFDRAKATAALTLFLLAGKYASVLMLLNDLMAPPDNPDESRRFWCQQSQIFHSTYLEKQSVVLEGLERENKLNLITTNRVLTNLRIFFDRVRAGSFDEAWELLVQLDLVPTSRADLSSKVRMYQELEPTLKSAFPALLKGAMECLYGQHRRVKTDYQGNTPTAQSRLLQLQQLAQLLNSFAGLADVPGNMKDAMSRLEAHMI